MDLKTNTHHSTICWELEAMGAVGQAEGLRILSSICTHTHIRTHIHVHTHACSHTDIRMPVHRYTFIHRPINRPYTHPEVDTYTHSYTETNIPTHTFVPSYTDTNTLVQDTLLYATHRIHILRHTRVCTYIASSVAPQTGEGRV